MKNSVCCILSVCMLAMVPVSSTAQQINITGTVKNTQGQPIAGAGLILIAQNKTAVSNTLGQYLISSLVAVALQHRGLSENSTAPVSFSHGFLYLTLASREMVDVGLYSINGAKISRVARDVYNEGEHRLALYPKDNASQLRILRIQIGTAAYTAALSPFGSIAPSIISSIRPLSSKAALAAPVDSILATAKGYQSKTVPVLSYVSTVDIVLSPAPVWSGNASIDAVFFAQTHVLEDTAKLFRLVSSRECLIKAHVISSSRSLAPQVFALLDLKGKTFNLELNGPDTLPLSIPKAPGLVQHSYANTFTAIIPKDWVQPGLKITVEAGNKTRVIDSLKIGAPTLLRMRMIDVHYFTLTPSDYPAGWLPEFEAKRPVAAIQLQRLPSVVFPSLVIPPRANLPAARISSKAEYKEITGQNFDGEQAAALYWNSALKAANGTAGRIRLYYMNIYGAYAGGQAGGFSGVGNGNSLGILNHEAGHSLSLPHWGDNVAYPYKGDMYGIPAPAIYNGTHAGPTWAFDLPSRRFINCVVQRADRNPGTYRGDPMQGGGVGDQDSGYTMRHFSDYSVKQMQGYLEGHVVMWSDSLKSYVSWNNAAGSYSTLVANNGVQYPVVRDVQVVSVMAAVSAVTPQANLVYPPIGPYEAGLITLFDPAVAADRAKADSIFCPTGGCDVSLRVTQGGSTKTYMLPIALDAAADPLTGASFQTRAINLPAGDGKVTKVEMLSTPDAEKSGLPAIPKVLDTWQ